MKFKATLNKTFSVDTDTDWDGDVDRLVDILRENSASNPPTNIELADAILCMMEQDGVDSVLEPDISETDFTIEIVEGTVELPEEDDDE